MANKKVGFFGAVIIIVIVIAIIGYIAGGSNTNTSSSSSSSSRPTETVYTLDIRPDSQKRLIEICIKYDSEYRRGANELQKSATRTNRRRELQQLGLRSVNNWIGTLSSFGTNRDGKAYITINMDDNVSVKTWNNALSDNEDNTLIAQDSSLYRNLSNMRTGARVRFSGSFLTGDDRDFFKVSNFTETFAMSTPEFLMRFTAVSLLSELPFTTQDVNMREEPSAESTIVILLNNESRVRLLSNPDQNGWVRINFDGKEGYVNSRFLTY